MMTLGAIAVIGALIIGVLFSALLERRAAMQQLLRARALDAAELALAGTISRAAWDSVVEHHPASRHRREPLLPAPCADAIDSVRIAKLSSRFLLVDLRRARRALAARFRETPRCR